MVETNLGLTSGSAQTTAAGFRDYGSHRKKSKNKSIFYEKVVSAKAAMEYQDLLNEAMESMKLAGVLIGTIAFFETFPTTSNPREALLDLMSSKTDWVNYINALNGLNTAFNKKISDIAAFKVIQKNKAKRGSDRYYEKMFWKKVYYAHLPTNDKESSKKVKRKNNGSVRKIEF